MPARPLHGPSPSAIRSVADWIHAFAAGQKPDSQRDAVERYVEARGLLPAVLRLLRPCRKREHPRLGPVRRLRQQGDLLFTPGGPLGAGRAPRERQDSPAARALHRHARVHRAALHGHETGIREHQGRTGEERGGAHASLGLRVATVARAGFGWGTRMARSLGPGPQCAIDQRQRDDHPARDVRRGRQWGRGVRGQAQA